MEYKLKDIYPTMGIEETSTAAIPVPEEQAALQDDAATAESVRPHYANGKKIALSVIVLSCLVVFLGSIGN